MSWLKGCGCTLLMNQISGNLNAYLVWTSSYDDNLGPELVTRFVFPDGWVVLGDPN